MKSGVHHIYIFLSYLIILQNKAARGNLYQVRKRSDHLWETLVCIFSYFIINLRKHYKFSFYLLLLLGNHNPKLLYELLWKFHSDW